MAVEIAAEMRAIHNMRAAHGDTAIFTHCLSPHVAIVRQVEGRRQKARLRRLPSRNDQGRSCMARCTYGALHMRSAPVKR